MSANNLIKIGSKLNNKFILLNIIFIINLMSGFYFFYLSDPVVEILYVLIVIFLVVIIIFFGFFKIFFKRNVLLNVLVIIILLVAQRNYTVLDIISENVEFYIRYKELNKKIINDKKIHFERWNSNSFRYSSFVYCDECSRYMKSENCFFYRKFTGYIYVYYNACTS